MPRPKQRTPELRAHLLQAALQVLASDGVAGFTTRRVAADAETSAPAVYELFGDKAGLVREVFFEGFRLLDRTLADVPPTDDPGADVRATVGALRAFVADHAVLADVMFSRPFADFDPGPSELAAGAEVRRRVVRLVRRAVDAGVVEGDETDIAQALLALALGLAGAETAGRLGSSSASVDRRWTTSIDALLRGFAPPTGP